MERARQRKYISVFRRVGVWECWSGIQSRDRVATRHLDVGNACCNNNTQVLPNSALNRVFALGQTPFFNSFGITSYDLTHFTPLAVASLAELNSFNSVSTAKFIQWGTNGLGFIL